MILVVPLALPSLAKGTTYTVATRPSNPGEETTQRNELPPITTKPKSIGSGDPR